ncbi:MAG: 3'-5' exonuclease, partial [Spirochaetaceae bacterium]|nr:3'-5' exonuclease [Spirochaetaceae bacterium]
MCDLAALIDRVPIARCLSYLWYEAGYRARLLEDPVAGAFEDHFELVHSLAARADARGARAAAFVASLELSIGAPDKIEAEAPRDGSRGLRIMTIHKSKGLEFPIVIVPQANNVGPNDSGDPWIWIEGLGPVFRFPEGGSDPRKRINAFFEEGRSERESRTRAELKRLLYVALTRAESHIVVSSCAPASTDGKGRSFRSLLSRPFGLFSPPSPLATEDVVDAGGEARSAPDTASDAAPREAAGPFAALRRLPSGLLAGKIRDRTDAEYFALVRGARSRSAAGYSVHGDEPALVERALPARDASVTALVRDLEAAEGPEEIFARDELSPPTEMTPEDWGSLVHAIVRAELEGREAAGFGNEAETALEALSP